MKKILAFLFAALLVTSFVACNENTTPGDTTPPEAGTPTEQADTSCLPENLAPGESEAQCKAFS